MVTLQNATNRRAAIVVSAVGFLALLVVSWFLWLRSPPQLGTDEEVYNSVDALFTAVTARDEKLLTQCEQRLSALKGAGKLPDAAANHLEGVIGQARAGRWESAASQLYDFMLSQRREGVAVKHTPKDTRRPVSSK